MAYAVRQDLYDLGLLPRGALASVGRLADSVIAATDIVTLSSHGFATDDVVTVRAAEGGTLAAPLVAGTSYYVIRLTDATFKLSATAGGGAINLSTDGTSVVVARDINVERLIEAVCSYVDGFLPAHLVPFPGPDYPPVLVDIVCQFVAARVQASTGVDSAIVRDRETKAQAQLERWAKGLSIRDSNAAGPANLAVSGAPKTSGRYGTDDGGGLP